MIKKQAIVAYVPALHQGYLNFFDTNKGDIYLLDSLALVNKAPRLERDIRALPANKSALMLKQVYPERPIKVWQNNTLNPLLKEYLSVCMPDEDISHELATTVTNVADLKKISFSSTFLRWDRQISTTEYEVSPDRIVSKSKRDHELIGVASSQAALSRDWWRQVGAVLVKGDRPVLTAHNQTFPDATYSADVFGDPRSNFDAGEHIETSKVIHAEAHLIATAARKGIALEGLSLFVTTFPCPVCAKSVAAAGIKKVYYSEGYSLLDAEDIFKATGVELILVR